MNNLYLELMKKCLINQIYIEKEIIRCNFPGDLFIEKLTGKKLMKDYPGNLDDRMNGKDWPSVAHTMIGMKRLNNIQYCVEEIIKNNIQGDFIETGVWRGGATIFMRAVLKAYGITDKKVWVVDSFEGLPKPDWEQDRGSTFHKETVLAVSLEEVKRNFESYDLLDNQVCFLKGWFSDTLPIAPIKKLALLRLDGDMYKSTMDALENLYHKLSVGGYVIIDDYGVVLNCKNAVDDFRTKKGITERIIWIDHSGIYWQRLTAPEHP